MKTIIIDGRMKSRLGRVQTPDLIELNYILFKPLNNKGTDTANNNRSKNNEDHRCDEGKSPITSLRIRNKSVSHIFVDERRPALTTMTSRKFSIYQVIDLIPVVYGLLIILMKILYHD